MKEVANRSKMQGRIFVIQVSTAPKEEPGFEVVVASSADDRVQMKDGDPEPEKVFGPEVFRATFPPEAYQNGVNYAAGIVATALSLGMKALGNAGYTFKNTIEDPVMEMPNGPRIVRR